MPPASIEELHRVSAGLEDLLETQAIALKAAAQCKSQLLGYEHAEVH
jgi:hypothetical protein